MSLTTTIAAAAPVPALELFDNALTLLGTTAWRVSHDESYHLKGGRGVHTFATVRGQGLPAQVTVTSNGGHPLPDQAKRVPVEVYAAVRFETAYSFDLPFGVDVADFHAWLVTGVRAYLLARGVPCMWTSDQHETWHSGDVELLGDPAKLPMRVGA